MFGRNTNALWMYYGLSQMRLLILLSLHENYFCFDPIIRFQHLYWKDISGLVENVQVLFSCTFTLVLVSESGSGL